MRCSALGLAALLAACERPDMLIVCHNSNCVEPQDPDRDDTVEALQESLALGPVIDGIEMDLLVHEGRCLFAHDKGEALTAIDFSEAAQIVAEHLATRDEGSRFIVEIELKATDATTTSVDCALAAYDILRAATETRLLELDVGFGSYVPATLRAVGERRPAPTANVRTLLVLGLGIPQPLLDDNHPFSELDNVTLDVVAVHPGWITDTALRAVRSMDVEIAAWFLDFTRETLDGIERVRPYYVTTGQARTLRAWLDG
ncbi:MAG: hypothetical protein M4D80_39510 [Myxococcota bacterium]|nr:hypothetical protein [Myxococcota bacterium]